jgi:hypothetical protein
MVSLRLAVAPNYPCAPNRQAGQFADTLGMFNRPQDLSITYQSMSHSEFMLYDSDNGMSVRFRLFINGDQ